jgi:hypothetical protein
MRRIWKKYLGLTAGLLTASMQAVGADQPAARQVIARTGAPVVCAASTVSQNPLTVVPPSPQASASMGRPVPIASNVEQVGFRMNHAPIFRGQAEETLPLPQAQKDETAPPPRGVLPTPAPMVGTPPAGGIVIGPTNVPPGGMILGPTGSPQGGMVFGPGFVPPGGSMYVSGPTMPQGYSLMPGEPTFDTAAMNPDRFAAGDGISHTFTHFLSLETESLLWWMSGTKLPPLVTTGLGAPATFVPGALSIPTSQVLFGGGSEDTGAHAGTRVRANVWFDRDHAIGLEGSYFMLMEGSSNFDRASPGSPLLAIPVVSGDMESAVILADQNGPGAAAVELMNRLWGVEVNVKTNLLYSQNGHLDLLAGFRCMGFDENLQIGASRTTAGLMGMTTDEFNARNRFWGGQLGVNAEYRYGPFSLEGTARVAVGNTNQVLEVNGMSITNGRSAMGGIFTGRNNIGRFSRDQLTVLPEIGVKMGYNLTNCMRVTLGYNLLYWSDVVRPGEHIDRVVGGNHPALTLNSSDLWAHGVTAGLEMRY